LFFVFAFLTSTETQRFSFSQKQHLLGNKIGSKLCLMLGTQVSGHMLLFRHIPVLWYFAASLSDRTLAHYSLPLVPSGAKLLIADIVTCYWILSSTSVDGGRITRTHTERM
jgi:hypothetical protein